MSYTENEKHEYDESDAESGNDFDTGDEGYTVTPQKRSERHERRPPTVMKQQITS